MKANHDLIDVRHPLLSVTDLPFPYYDEVFKLRQLQVFFIIIHNYQEGSIVFVGWHGEQQCKFILVETPRELHYNNIFTCFLN